MGNPTSGITKETNMWPEVLGTNVPNEIYIIMNNNYIYKQPFTYLNM